ncbi:hemagglutinin repeat-containing protein [Enterobacteriaceae bacterium ESL0689]|nr:hemagglutinin repeat-containing protein [Enterobacteriaceae bacterium ESL0689]
MTTGSFNPHGQASVLNNHSATIESAGEMALAVDTLNNINDHFSTEIVTVSQETHHEYRHRGSSIRWDADTDGVYVDHNSSDGLLNLNTPDKHGSGHDNFYEYQYTRTIEEEQIKESDPGKILAGGRLAIQAGQVLNDKSQIVAGSALDIVATTIDNIMPEGQRRITDSGTVTHFWRQQQKGHDQQKRDRERYQPPVVIDSITLHPGRLEGNSTATGSGLQLTALTQTDAPSVSAGLTVTDPATLARPIADIPRPELSTATTATETPPEQPVVLLPGQTFEVALSSGGVSSDTVTVIKVSGASTQLPDNSLFVTHPDVQAPYLVETDPRFTDRKKWLGTDYMQNAFAQDPANIHKRLGDGFYEQRLVREQVIALTGGRYLGDYRSDEAQFKGLMDAGIAFGQQYDLIPGVALSPAQMRLLTHDILWLVDTPVQLPDGSWQTVQVPQVYARVNPDAPDGAGALLAGREVTLNLSGDLLNHGTISGQQVRLTADNLINQAGTVHGADVSLQARTDIISTGGLLSATHSLLAAAGRDITLTSPTVSASRQDGSNSYDRTTIQRTSGIQVTGDGGWLQLAAGRDITLTAAEVNNQASNSQSWLTAGHDLILNTVTTSARDHLVWDKDNWLTSADTQQNGSTVSGGGRLTLQAGHDLSATAATVSAGQNLGIAAGNDIRLDAGINTTDYEEHQRHSGGNGAFSSTTTVDLLHQQQAQGTLLSGDTVTVQAGHDLTFTGSDAVAEHQLYLSAGHDLTLTTTAEHGSEFHQTEEKHSGLSGSGGIGLTYGSQSQKVTDSAQTLTQHGSTAGATQGDVILHAGDVLTVNGSELIAGHDMVLSGQSVALTAATEHSQQTHSVEQRTSGLTLALSGSAGTALSNTVQSVNQAKGRDNDRLQALYAVKGGLSAIQASQAVRLDEAQGAAAENDNTIGISLSYGSQSSKSTQQQTQYSAATSSLTAGNNLTVVASGKDGKGNILAEGSQLQATHDITLDAQHDITLLSAQNASSLTGSNHSSGGNLGIGIGVGSGGWGIHISAGVNAGKGSERGNGTTHDETIIGAGHQLSLHSGNDTTLQGAQLSGDRLLADIGHNLTISSEQDSDHYHSQQQNISASGSFTWGSMSGSGSISASRDKMNSDFLSVNEQSGLFAGNGGYDITVGSHTQLNGAVIASTTDKNRLDTGTLGWGSLHNSAEYDVEHSSAGMSSGGSIGSQFTGNMASSLLNGLSDHGKADGTTQSAVSNGTLIIRDKDHQQQDIAGLSHDTEKANGSIRPIFDKEKEQDKIEQAQVIGDIGNQLADIGRTEGNIRATQAGKLELAGKGIYEPEPGASAEDRERYNTLLANTEGYKAEQQKWGTGGSYQQAIQATTAALQGLNGGSVTAAIAGAAEPYIAEIIGHHAGIDNNDEAKVAAHAVANAVLASLQGQSALAGAAGAATGELTGILAMQIYDKPVSELSETDKQNISAMATLAAGIAGGIAGDSTAAAVVGAQAGKTTVENNFLNSTETRALDKELSDCKASGGDCQKVVEKYLEISNKKSKELTEACTGGGVTCVSWEELIQGATNVANDANPLQIRLDEKLKDPDAAALVNYLNGTDLKFLNDNITQGDRVLSVVSDPTSWPVLVMGGKAILTNAVNNTKEQLIAVGVGAGLSAGIQYGTTGEVKLSDLIGSVVVGGITAGKGYNPTVTWNAAGGYYQAEISGNDPFMAALLSKAGASAGYAAGNVIKVPFDKKLNPISKQYEWVPTGIWTITKPAPQHPLPSIMGNIGDSAVSGMIQDKLKDSGGK